MFGVIGVAALFPVTISPGVVGVAVNGVGDVPTVLAAGVTGTLITLVLLGATLLIEPGLVQVTVCPTVVQVLLLLVNVAGALIPVGKVIVVVIMPVVGEVPIFVTVTGTILGVPTTNGVNGCPIVVTKSGAGVAATGVVGVIGVAALFPVTVSPGVVGDAVNGVGVVPTVLAAGVTGTFITAVLFGTTLLIGPGLVQVTVCPLVVQVLLLLVNVAGALVPAGKVIVVVITPVVGAEP